ncbi:hypothetical protein NUSPORA_00791 [Nucleospora cyclopteri]
MSKKKPMKVIKESNNEKENIPVDVINAIEWDNSKKIKSTTENSVDLCLSDNEGMLHKNTENSQIVNLKDEMKFLYQKISKKGFGKSEQVEFERIINFFTIETFNNESNVSVLLNSLFSFCETPCLHFYKNKIYKILFSVLEKPCKIDISYKVNVFTKMTEIFDLSQLFTDLIDGYSGIENIPVSDSSFRNFALLKIITTAMKNAEISFSTLKKQKKKKSINASLTEENNRDAETVNFHQLDFMIDKFSDCNQFVKFLSENCKNIDVIKFVLYYTFKWLTNIEVDLFNLKSPKDVENIDEKRIGRFFEVFPLIDKYLKKIENHKNSLKLIFYLYESNADIFKILWSNYQRIFYFFLMKNKKKLSHVKILRVFDRSMQHSIYHKLKNHKECLINVFKQINPKYLVLELEKTKSKYILESINNECGNIKMTNKQLKGIYRNFFSILERGKEINFSVRNLQLFAEEFSNLPFLMKEEVKIHLNRFIPVIHKEHLNNLSVLEMLCYNSNINVDIVELVGKLVDNPNLLYNKSQVLFTNLIIKLIYLKREFLTAELISRTIPIIRNSLKYKEFIRHIGKLFNSLCDCNIRLVECDYAIVAYGAIKHPNFIQIFNQYDWIADKYYGMIFYLDYLFTSVEIQNEELEFINTVMPVKMKEILVNNSDEVLVSLILELFNTHIECENTKLTHIIPNFINNNIKTIQELFFEYKEYISCLFIKALRLQYVVPISVVPYILISYNVDFIHRNYLDTCINSITICMELLTNYLQGETAEEISAILDEFTLFISNVYNITSVNKILKSMEIKEDALFIYILLRNLKGFISSDRDRVFLFLRERINDDNILEMIDKAVKYYENKIDKRRKSLPIEYLKSTE